MDPLQETNGATIANGSVSGPEGRLCLNYHEGDGLPVVFCHSFGGSSEHWIQQLRHLRQSHSTIAFDFRGHGCSDAPEYNLVYNAYTPEQMAGDIAAIVDNTHLQQFILVGHSMGGAVAIAYAQQHSERVAGLLLTGTPGQTPREDSNPVIETLESDRYQEVMDKYMDKLLANATEDTRELVEYGFKKLSREASLSIIKSLFEYNPLPALNSYRGTKMIVHTKGDNQPSALHMQVADIPVYEIDGTSHWIQLDKPDEFNNILDEMIERVNSPKPYK